jgi:zinc/manganese transport system ATP-binding protein
MRIHVHEAALGAGHTPLIQGLTGEFASGSMTAVLGPRHGGKSVLLKAIRGLVPLRGGRIRLDGGEADQLAYLPQGAHLALDPFISVMDVVLGWGRRRTRLAEASTVAQMRELSAVLEEVGLAGLAGSPIASLSMAQRRRALFAHLAMADAAAVLLDDPFPANDAATTDHLLSLVRGWHAKGRTVVVALSDQGLVRRHFPNVLLLARSPVAWGATAEVLTPVNLFKLRAMAEAWGSGDAATRAAG